MASVYKLRSKVWKYPGMAGWFFLSVPKPAATKIKKTQEGRPRTGWGSIRVAVTLGNSKWKTSIFPDAKSGTFLLPLKAAVRKKEGVGDKDTVSFSIEIQQ